MPDTGPLLALAEIAGVFVGFGALISVRGADGERDPHTFIYLRAVMWIGLWVLVAALAPVALSRYGVWGHALWLPCGILALALFAALWAVDATSPAMRTERAPKLRRLTVLYIVLAMPLTLGIVVSLGLVLIGRWPGAEDALYFTAITAGMVLSGMTLILLVFSVRDR
jgi:hypothetical protein